MSLNKPLPAWDFNQWHIFSVLAARDVGYSDTDVLRSAQTVPFCYWCQRIIPEGTPIVTCSHCFGIVYCSRTCREESWKNPPAVVTGGCELLSHEAVCQDYQRYLKLKPEIKRTLLWFPWGQRATDKTFPIGTFLAQRNLLGTRDFEYWSTDRNALFMTRLSRACHLVDANFIQNYKQTCIETSRKANISYPGCNLMKSKYPTDREGWHNLPDGEIPFLSFAATNSSRIPRKHGPGNVLNNWQSYYGWRRLSRNSPCALLLFKVMTIYWMLVDSLKIKPLPEGTRKQLVIHLIDVDSELNFLPLFGELALLLPGWEISFLLFGRAVRRVIDEAKLPKNKKSLARTKGPIFKYTAPTELGTGSVSITLWRGSPVWKSHEVLGKRNPRFIQRDCGDERLITPDILMALDPCIARFKEDWYHVLKASCFAGIPFLMTECSELKMERSTIPVIDALWKDTVKIFSETGIHDNFPQIIGDRWAKMKQVNELPVNMRWPTKLNPFHCPGQRQTAIARLPNVGCGFTIYLQAYKDLKLLRDCGVDPLMRKLIEDIETQGIFNLEKGELEALSNMCMQS